MNLNEISAPATAGGGGRVEQVIAALHEHIRANGLGPGDPLPSEGGIAAQLGVSRPVVREAFSSMAALKLINIGNGRRARVSALDRSVMAHVLDHAVVTDQISEPCRQVLPAVELESSAIRGGGVKEGEQPALTLAFSRQFSNGLKGEVG